MTCTYCGAAIPAGAATCPGCGAALAGGAPTMTTHPTTSIEESPARAGAVLPLGGNAEATSDVRDSTLVIWGLVIAAIVVAIIWLAAH
ncbi:MAG TPA: zinc-ribbon domain-containing protein [Mycobacteriales bacterium]|nr:zinc-ribbon domain-containing protein [Mycobacteriales bacterium]